jgi:hypothetical protein
MKYAEAVERLQSHRRYLQIDHNKGCNYSTLLESLDIAINAVQNCNTKKINLIMDGNSWCAYRDGFINLQESNAGFGDTPDEAIKDLEVSRCKPRMLSELTSNEMGNIVKQLRGSK